MRTLIIGSGFVGSALAMLLLAQGDEAVVASRHPPSSHPTLPWVALDVTVREDCARVLQQAAFDAVVLVHGPSDVTWCEQHPEQTLWNHETAARNIAQLAEGRRMVMISSDNVFDGRERAPDEATPTCPTNAYGRAKLAAERAIAQATNTVVLRVSLIYGWEPAESTKWLNFFASCTHRLCSGLETVVPFDQWSTPVLLEDVIAVTAALLRAPHVPPLLHLGGPERISRAAWATLIADRLDAAPDLVLPEPKANGRYASRPANSCLASRMLHMHPSTAAVRIRGVREGTGFLLNRELHAMEPQP